MERFIAIDNVCAFPNLTLLPDGTIVAAIFNQPHHEKAEGDIECWASTDGGYLWERRGLVTRHAPNTAYAMVAAGLGHDGALVAVCGGHDNLPAALGQPRVAVSPQRLLPIVCRSTDGGWTWQQVGTLPRLDGFDEFAPYGDIVPSLDGSLLVAVQATAGYVRFAGMDDKPEMYKDDAYVLRSHDSGVTWPEPVCIGPDINETALLHLGDDRFLAASRTKVDMHLELYHSEDGGKSWVNHGPLTSAGQHPGHLLRLADGRIVLAYGIRNHRDQGVAVRLSDDEGRTWKWPVKLVDLEDATDIGYPSSVQVADGTIVTAFYTRWSRVNQRYHMGVVRWKPEEFKEGFGKFSV